MICDPAHGLFLRLSLIGMHTKINIQYPASKYGLTKSAVTPLLLHNSCCNRTVME